MNEEHKINIKKIIEEYKKSFDGLSKEQTLLFYYKILEILNLESEKMKDEDNFNELITALSFALKDNIGIFKTICLGCNYKNAKKYEILYEKSLISYNKVLENYKKLAEELKISSSLELSHLFAYMLWNGYYSVDKKHFYNLKDRLTLPNLYSFDVIKGKGVCLAYAELLHNYLTVCQKESSLLLCKVPTQKNAIKINYCPEIEKHYAKINLLNNLSFLFFMSFLKPCVNIVGNHAVTLIKDDNKMFIYDPTNLSVLKIIDEQTASIINGKGTFEIKPNQTMLLNIKADPYHLFEKLSLDQTYQSYSRKEIIFTFEEIIELVKSNTNLLESAYDNIHPELEIISQQIDEIGRNDKTLIKSLKTK